MKRTSVAVSILAVVAALVLPAGVGAATAADPYDCQAGAVVIVAGTGDVNTPSQIGVEQRYTGLTWDNKPDPNSPYHDDPYRVIKPEFPTTLWPLGTVGYDDDVQRGISATNDAIAEYQRNCPDKPVVVTGYSQGARIAGDVLNQIGTSTESKVVDGVTYYKVVDADGTEYWIDRSQLSGELYADPRRDGPESGRGIEQSMIGVIPGLTMSGKRPGGFGTIPVTSYCYQGDPICDLPDPLHDPFGAFDGLVGYFNKHGYYPWRMFKPVDDPMWECVDKAPNGAGYVDCMVPAPSAISLVRRDLVDQVRGLVGLPERAVIDFWGMAPNVNGIFPHANLADLQKYLTPVMGVLPQLPNLGFGAYLPDLYVFTGMLQGIVGLDAGLFGKSVEDLGRSAASVFLVPVNFVRTVSGKPLIDVRPPLEPWPAPTTDPDPAMTVLAESNAVGPEAVDPVDSEYRVPPPRSQKTERPKPLGQIGQQQIGQQQIEQREVDPMDTIGTSTTQSKGTDPVQQDPVQQDPVQQDSAHAEAVVTGDPVTVD